MAPLSHAGGRHGLPAGDLETAAQPLWLRVGGCGGAQGLDPNLTQNGTFWDVCKSRFQEDCNSVLPCTHTFVCMLVQANCNSMMPHSNEQRFPFGS